MARIGAWPINCLGNIIDIHMYEFDQSYKLIQVFTEITSIITSHD